MKKNYIKPELELSQLECESMIAVSIAIGSDGTPGDDAEVDSRESLFLENELTLF